MNSLFIYNENIINTLKIEVLDVISIISITCGILVIITNNPVVSVLFLIGLFLSISVYLIMLGIHFIGLSYLLVYVGAVSILFLFILMFGKRLLIFVIVSSEEALSTTITWIFLYALSFFNDCRHRMVKSHPLKVKIII